MKRLLSAFVLIALVCSLLSASVVIEAEGSGKTIEEAKENARVALSQKVFPGTYYGKTEISEHDDGKESSALFSEYSTYTIVGEFPGFEYSDESLDKNGYHVTTRITGDSSTLSYYSQRQKESSMNVEEFYRRYLSLDGTSSASIRREALGKVIIYYYAYNMYSNILLRLGGELAYTVDIDTPFEVLLEDYSSLLIEEANELDTLDIIAEAENKTGAGKSEKLSDSALAEAEAQAELYRSLVLEKSISGILEKRTTEAVSADKSAFGIARLNSYAEAVRMLNAELVELSAGYDALVDEEKTAIVLSFEKEASAIRNRAYRIVELDPDGNVASFASEARENEISELKKQKTKEIEDAVDIINASLGPAIQEKYNLLSSVLEEIKSEEFSISSEVENIVLTDISNYDGGEYCWHFGLSAERLGYTVENLTLSYSDVTGVKIPRGEKALAAFMGTDESSEYNVNVLKYTGLLRSGGYSLELRFSAGVSLEKKVLVVVPKALVIAFSDGVSAEISLESEEEIYYDIEMESPGYLSYTWLKRNSRAEKNLVDARNEKGFLDFSSWTTKWGYHLATGFSAGNAFREEIGGGYWVDFGINWSWGSLFVSGTFALEYGFSGKFSYLSLASFIGVGIQNSTGSLAAGCNFSLGNSGLMLFPYASYYFSIKSEGKFGLIAGLCINAGSGKLSFVLGFDSENLLQMIAAGNEG